MFSAFTNAQNKSSAPIPLTSAVFEYSNNGDDWFPIPSPLGASATYDGLSYEFRVFSVSPGGATYSSSIPSPIIDSGSTAQLSVTGTGSYTGTITSGVFVILQRTITASADYGGASPVSSSSCNVDGSVAGFDITPSNLVTGATGVTISIIYGTDIYNTTYGGYNFYAPVAGVGNIGYVNSNIPPYQNFVVNTNASFTIYCNENDNSTGNYWWVVCNPHEWTDNTGVITANPAYNSNYSVAVVKVSGNDAYFDNTCV